MDFHKEVLKSYHSLQGLMPSDIRPLRGPKKCFFRLNFCYKSVMDRMKNIYDKLEMYNDYL